MNNASDKRIALMRQGADVLLQWLEDIINQGIAQLKTTNSNYWEHLATLMVDHKLGSIARRIRRFGPIIQDQDDWFDAILSEIGQLYLIAKGLFQLESYPKIIQAELLAQAGKSMTKKEVLATTPTQQLIRAMGQSFGQEEQLTFRKTWYWLDHVQRFGMELDFIVGRKNAFPPVTPVGLVSQATVYDYPSILPSRILLGDIQPLQEDIQPHMLDHFDEMIKQFRIALGQNPWLIDFPCVIKNIHPVLNRNEIILVDQNNNTVEIAYKPAISEYLSLYTNKALVHIFGTWDGAIFSPISLIVNGLFSPLTVKEKKTDFRKFN